MISGFNPKWNEVKLSTNIKRTPEICYQFKNQVDQEEISFLIFMVMDKDTIFDDYLCGAAIPINCLKSGFRVVRLYDYKGDLLPYSKLFVYVSVE